MTFATPPPHPDDLAGARAADRLNAWLDGRRDAGTAEPPLAAVARDTARRAVTGVPDAITRDHADRLWEDLMRPQTTTAPYPRTHARWTTRSAPAPEPPGHDILPRRSRPGVPDAHPLRHRFMGMVATLTLLALLGVSALAVVLNAPRDPGSGPLAGLSASQGDDPVVTPTPVRADATPLPGAGVAWLLPDGTFTEIAPPGVYGERWDARFPVTLSQPPGAAFQVETRAFVDATGNRIQVRLVRYVDDAQFGAAYAYLTGEIETVQATLSFTDDPARTERLQVPLTGCEAVLRAEGIEPLTGYPVSATLCRADASRVILLATVNGTITIIENGALTRYPADTVVVGSLPYVRLAGTPVPNP